MTDTECTEFLHWALPRLRMRWPGFRKVRGQVCKRVERRRRELGLGGVSEYREYLEAHDEEWRVLDGLMNVTISRFYRDRRFFDQLGTIVLPALARRGELRVWSAGCASGEEAYTVVLICAFRVIPARLSVLGTDADETVLARADAGCYKPSSLKELPEEWRRAAFDERDGLYRLRPEHREPLTLMRHDVRSEPPEGPFDLVLCRNLAFTYFDEPLQRDVAARLAATVRRGGALAVGAHERLPETAGLVDWPGVRGVYSKE